MAVYSDTIGLCRITRGVLNGSVQMGPAKSDWDNSSGRHRAAGPVLWAVRCSARSTRFAIATVQSIQGPAVADHYSCVPPALPAAPYLPPQLRTRRGRHIQSPDAR